MIVDLTAYKTGCSDCLKQVTFCIAIAKLRADTTLCVKQNLTQHCPYRIIDLLEVSGFDVKPWDTSCGNTELRFDHTINVSNKPADIKLSKKEFLEKWYAAYRLLRPKDHIQKRIDLLDINDSHLGIHVRMTDKVKKKPLPWEIKQNQIGSVVRSSRNLIRSKIKKYGLNKIFLACDSLESKIEWSQILAKYNVKVLSNPDVRFDTNSLRQTGGEDFIVDLFSLSRCHAIVGTTRSWVPEVARLIGDVKDISFGVDHAPLVVIEKKLSRYKRLFLRYFQK